MTTTNLMLVTVLKKYVLIQNYDEKSKTVENQVVPTIIPLHLIPTMNHSILPIFKLLNWIGK